MKYLKVKMSSAASIEWAEEIAEGIKNEYPISVDSVEICDEPQEVKRTEIGTLDIGEGLLISKKELQCAFDHGEIVNLNNYPELRQHCKDIKTNWNFDGIKESTRLEVCFSDGVRRCGYLGINAQGNPVIYSSTSPTAPSLIPKRCTDIKSIRVL